MATPFTLTAPPPASHPYQWSEDGQSWVGMSLARLRRMVEWATAYPDDAMEAVAAGGVVRLKRGDSDHGYIRRRPTAAEVAAVERQPSLF